MKKILYLLFAVMVVMSGCQKDKAATPDPIPTPEPEPIPVVYTMPIMGTNRVVVKNELAKISTNIIETKSKGYVKLVCVPTDVEDNMFKTLTYEFYSDGFDFNHFIFNYKLDESKKLTDLDLKKLKDYLKSNAIPL